MRLTLFDFDDVEAQLPEFFNVLIYRILSSVRTRYMNCSVETRTQCS